MLHATLASSLTLETTIGGVLLGVCGAAAAGFGHGSIVGLVEFLSHHSKRKAIKRQCRELAVMLADSTTLQQKMTFEAEVAMLLHASLECAPRLYGRKEWAVLIERLSSIRAGLFRLRHGDSADELQAVEAIGKDVEVLLAIRC